MKKRKKQLSGKHLIKVLQLFQAKNWEIQESYEGAESLFNRYCQRLLDIGENKRRELMLELTERYLWLPLDKYEECLISSLTMFVTSDMAEKIEKIYVMPLIAPADADKMKSSKLLTYTFNSPKLRFNPALSKKEFQVEYDVKKIKTKLENEDAILLLVDDYIGTGETAEKCLLHMKEEKIPDDRLVILSLVAQEQGIEYIEKYNIPVVASIIMKKGISDYYTGDELNEKVALMKDIERRLSVKDLFKFGYKGSEALVTMCRTPNNTFPLFWNEEGNMKNAPFPRN